jgi:hypothetical protein
MHDMPVRHFPADNFEDFLNSQRALLIYRAAIIKLFPKEIGNNEAKRIHRWSHRDSRYNTKSRVGMIEFAEMNRNGIITFYLLKAIPVNRNI